MKYIFAGALLEGEDRYISGPDRVTRELYNAFGENEYLVCNIILDKSIKSRLMRIFSFVYHSVEFLKANEDSTIIISGIKAEGIILTLCKRLKIIGHRLVYIAHGCARFELSEGICPASNVLTKLFYDVAEKNILNACGLIVPVSEQLKKNLLCFYPAVESKCKATIPNGIQERFKDFDRIDVREKYLDNVQKKIVFFVGGFRKIKNIDVLMSCFIQNGERLKDFILVIAGDRGDMFDDLCEFIDQKNIYYVGKLNQHQLKSFYKEARMVVLPSLFDSYPLTFLETLCFSKPIIISKNVGAYSYDKSMHNFVRVLEDVSPESICRAIVEVDSMISKKEIDKHEIQEYVKNFYWNNIARKYNNYLKQN